MRPLLNFYPQLPLLIAKRAPRSQFSSALFVIFTFILLLSMALPALAQSDSEKPSEPELLPIAGSPIPKDLREAMILGKATEGLEILDRLAEEKPERQEDWLFFQASLLEQTDQSKPALEMLRKLESDYPNGRWFHRARFLKARILKDLGRFGEAQRIIEQETLRLHSEERRIELASLLIEEGDLLSAERDPGVVEEKPRDLLKAHAVYQQAAELNPPAPLLEKALFALVRCSDEIGFPHEDADRYVENFDYREKQGNEVIEDEYFGKNLLTVLLSRTDSMNPVMKRRSLEDLIARIDNEISGHPWRARFFSENVDKPFAEIRQESLLRIIDTYRQAPSRLAATRRFIEVGEGHPQYWETRFQLGSLIEQTSGAEQAIDHWLELFGEIPALTEDSELAKLRSRTLFTVGNAHWNLANLESALETFRKYVSEFPDGAEWAQSQENCIEIEARICERLLSEEDYSAARNAIDTFSQKYPIHGKTLPLLYQSAKTWASEARSKLADSDLQEASVPEEVSNLLEKTITELRALNGKYPTDNEGQRAIFDVAVILEEDLLKPADAVETYRECFGGSYESAARSRLAQLTKIDLSIETERLYRSTDAASFTLDTRNIESVSVDLFPIDIQAYFRKYQSRKNIEQLDLDLIDPWKSFDVDVLGHEPYRPCSQRVDLPVDGQGTWAVVVTAGELKATTLVVRTDLDMIVQAGRKDVLIYAQDMVQMKPAPQTRILIATPGPDDQPVIQDVVTGSDGTVRIQYEGLKQDDSVRVLAIRENDSAVSGVGLGNTLVARGLSPLGHILMDSATYQPGDSVRWSALVRDLKDQQWSLPAGETGRVRIFDPQGMEIFREESSFGDLGTLHGSVDLPTSAPMGLWRLEIVSPNGFRASQNFNVEVPKPLPVQLDFTAERNVYVRGEQIELKVSAQTWYGKPLGGTAVSILLPYQNEQIEEKLILDDQGSATFTFDSRTAESSTLNFVAILQSEGIQRTLQIPLRQRLWEISLEIPRRGGQFMLGESVPVTVLAKDLSGEPVSKTMTLSLSERVRRANRWSVKRLEEFEVSTDKNGLAQIRVPLEKAGSLILKAEGIDRWGHPISAQKSIRVFGEKDDSQLLWLVDDVALVIGEEKELSLQCNGTSGPALLTILGDQLVNHRIVNLRKGKNTLSFIADPAIRSAATLRLAMMNQTGLHKAETTFKIRRQLKVSITPPDGAINPGDEVTLEVETKDLLDQPVSAEIALAVLDASIDDLYPDWFRKLTVSQSSHDPARILSIASSCEFRYTGVTKAIEESLLAEERRLEEREMEKSLSLGLEVMANADAAMPAPAAEMARQVMSRGRDRGLASKKVMYAEGASGGAYGSRFGRGLNSIGGRGGKNAEDLLMLGEEEKPATRYLAFWEGALKTDSSGKGTVTFRVPDRNSTWRIRARGVASGDLFGENQSNFVTREKLVIESLIPQIALEGDEITPRVRIFNDTGLQTQASVSISWPSGYAENVSERIIALLPGLQEVLLDRWPALGTDPDLPYRITVTVDGQSWTQDGKVSIQRWGLDAFSRDSWILSGESQREKVGISEGTQLLDRKLRLTLGATIDSGLVNRLTSRPSMSRLIPGPSPEISDNFTTASQLIAYLQALAISSEQSGSINKPDEEQLRALTEKAIQRLVTAQNSRGDWSWIPAENSRSDTFSVVVTSWVFESLSMARSSGFSVPDRVFSRAIPHLEEKFRNTDQSKLNQKAILLSALASSGSADFGAANRLHRNRTKLSNSGLGALIRALSHLKKNAMATEVVQTLLDRQNDDGSWSDSDTKKAEFALYRGGRFLTAMSLHSLLMANAPNSALESTSRWLRNQLTFQLNRSSALSIAALLKWQSVAVPSQRACEVIFSINGTDRGTLRVGDGKNHDSLLLELGDGPGEFDLATRVSGDSGAFFTAELSGHFEGYPELKDRDLSVNETQFLTVPPRMSGRELPIGFNILRETRERWKNNVRHLLPGESSRFELKVSSPGNRSEFVEMEVQIPSGLILDQDSLNGNFTYHEYRRGVLKIWGTLNRRINTEFSVVAVSPGEYRMPPVIIRSVAEPQRMTVGKSQVVTVLNSGEINPDEYRPTPDELYARGTRLWEDGRWRESRQTLEPLWTEYSEELKTAPAREMARILMLSAMEAGDNSSMVSFFEILKERNPDLSLSLVNFMRLGEAYRVLGESSRSMEIFSAVNEAIFARDRKVSDLLSASDLIPALNLLQRLTLENPPTPAVLAAEQYLADVALGTSSGGGDLSMEDRISLGLNGRRVLYRFLALHGSDPTAPDAGLNLVSNLLGSKNWTLARRESEMLAKRYQKPRYLDSFRYTQAVAMWALGEDDDALQLLEEIASSRYPIPSGGDRPSENRDLALFIIGQIHHAANQPEKASEYYEQVQAQFADARDSLRQINARELELDEISEFRPGDPVAVELRYRNIDSAEVLAYKVNLMTLALREQDLSRVTEVKLSGISPTLSKTVELGAQGTAGGTLHTTRKIEIPIEEEGAYLVIVRGGDVHTSGLILVNRMEMVVQNRSGSLRVQIVDPTTGNLIPDVDVRVLNPYSSRGDGTTFGTTDKRGLFLAATANQYTVIARRGKSDYAFYRMSGPSSRISEELDEIQGWYGQEMEEDFETVQQLQMEDYFQNVIRFNADNLGTRNSQWRTDVEATQKGIQIKQATD